LRCYEEGMKTYFPPRKILAAVDGTTPSWAAFSAARSLASLLKCGLQAVYVEPIAGFAEMESASMVPALLKRNDRARREIKERLSGVTLKASIGDPIAELVKLAVPRVCHLMVMGTHGREGADRFLFGSVAEAVLHRARVPVLAVREAMDFDPKRILVPCNLEPYGDAALRYASALAKLLGASLTVLHVAAPHRWDVDAQAELDRHLGQVLGMSEASTVETIVKSGDAREQIAREAQLGRYGLLALSAHHRAQLSDLAMGTTAERLLRRCNIPLLAVPAPVSSSLRRPVPADPLAWGLP
jgi:nucleotide-binding universal stress UspA family protein